MNRVGVWILVPVLAVLLTATGFADIIPVVNGSFETLPAGGLTNSCAGAGCAYSIGNIPGWLISGSGGQFQPGAGPYFNTLSDGPTSAYSNGGVISQTVGETVQVGVTYTLLVDLGYRTDVPFAGSADLLINGNRYSAVGSTPVIGNWSTFTATYTGLSADAGDSITIELNSSGAQGNYDNVRLSDSNNSLPEPSYAGMLGMGLAGLTMLVLRRREA